MRKNLLLASLCVMLAGCGAWGISINTNEDSSTPLEKAALAGDLIGVKKLLAAGGNPNNGSRAFGSPLNAAVVHPNNPDVIRTLLLAGANPNGRAEEGSTCWAPPVTLAASTGDLANTQLLLNSGAAIPNSHCSTLIVGWLKPPMIELLRQYGLNLLDIDEKGQNALHAAFASQGVPNIESIEYLIRAGVPVNARDHRGKTPLALWREPRSVQHGWFTDWLSHLTGDESDKIDMNNHDKISALLQSSGAQI